MNIKAAYQFYKETKQNLDTKLSSDAYKNNLILCKEKDQIDNFFINICSEFMTQSLIPTLEETFLNTLEKMNQLAEQTVKLNLYTDKQQALAALYSSFTLSSKNIMDPISFSMTPFFDWSLNTINLSFYHTTIINELIPANIKLPVQYLAENNTYKFESFDQKKMTQIIMGIFKNNPASINLFEQIIEQSGCLTYDNYNHAHNFSNAIFQKIEYITKEYENYMQIHNRIQDFLNDNEKKEQTTELFFEEYELE